MERLPVVDYKRLRRIALPPEETNISNKICMGILLVAMVVLYKRYRDKSHQPPRTEDILWL